MCSRYSLTSPPEAVRSYFAYRETPNFPPRYNVAPTQDVPVVCLDAGVRSFRMMRWGLLPRFVKDPKAGPPMINARSEGISKKSAFRDAFASRRCLLPADGFYEWTGPKGKRRPFFLNRPQGGLIALAGIWERWRGKDGEEIESVAVLTCAANAPVARLHDRMPVLLPQDRFEAWLDCKTTSPEEAEAMLLQPAADALLEATEMHPKINDSRRDEPGLQEPVQDRLL